MMPRMTIRQRAQLFHELGKLLGAGLHLDRSIELLLEQGPGAAVRTWLTGVRSGLAARLSVADAVAQYTSSGSLETSLLAAGERGGRLETSFEHLARYYDLKQKARDKAFGALVYPLILLHLGLLVPDLKGLVLGEGVGSMIPDFVQRLLIAWSAILVCAGVVVGALNLAAKSASMDRLLNVIPLLGGVRRHWALARFSQVFQTGLLAAFRISETLKLAGDASQSALIREASHAAAKKVETGQSLSASLRGTSVFPRTFMQSVATSEETGTLDTEMGRWAIAEAELAARAQDRAAEWLPRIFYVIVLLYVASRVIGTFAGYYGELDRMLDQQ